MDADLERRVKQRTHGTKSTPNGGTMGDDLNELTQDEVWCLGFIVRFRYRRWLMKRYERVRWLLKEKRGAEDWAQTRDEKWRKFGAR